MSLVAARCEKNSNMVGDSCGGSNSESSSQTLSSQVDWVTFEEPGEESKGTINCPPEEKPPDGKGRYLSRLGEFK